jgi:thioredoxin reductase
MAAASELAVAGLDVVLLERNLPGGQLFEEAGLVAPSGATTTGDDLAVALQEEVAARGVRFEFADALALDPVSLAVTTSVGGFAPDAVVIATGTRRRAIATEAGPVPEDMTCHCLPCDGPLLAGRRIALVGTGAPFWRDIDLARSFTDDVVVIVDDHATRLGGNEDVELQLGSIVAVTGAPGALDIEVRGSSGAVAHVSAAAVVATSGVEPVTEWLDPSMRSADGWVEDRFGPRLRVTGSVTPSLRHASPFVVEAAGRQVAAELIAALV